MNECICSSCKNLKGIIDENDGTREFECKFGFPSANCEECEGGECQESCENYKLDDEVEVLVKVKCSKCGKELETVSKDNSEGEVQCISCYLGNI